MDAGRRSRSGHDSCRPSSAPSLFCSLELDLAAGLPVGRRMPRLRRLAHRPVPLMRLNFGRFNPFTRRCRQSQRAKLGRNIPSTPLSWPNWNKTTWLAGGGIRGGKIIGATDEFGFRAVEDRIHVNDLHATIL